MVNPHFFFEGKLAREESASALLATLLEQSACFRNRFLDLIHVNLTEDPDVSVERNEVDVCLVFPQHKTTVLVENKTKASSKTDGQLAHYYEQAKDETPEHTIVCVYLAPTLALTKSELEQLDLRETDTCHGVEWSQISKLTEKLTDFDQELASKGCRAVLGSIKKSRQGYYDWEVEDRRTLREIINLARDKVPSRIRDLKYMTWSGKRSVAIDLPEKAITVCAGIWFEPDEETGIVTLARRGNDIVVDRSLKFKASGKWKPRQETTIWWNSIRQQGEWHGAGHKFRLEGRWMVTKQQVTGTPDEIAESIVDGFVTLLAALSDHLEPTNPAGSTTGV